MIYNNLITIIQSNDKQEHALRSCTSSQYQVPILIPKCFEKKNREKTFNYPSQW